MGLLVVGSVAFDSVETPVDKINNALGVHIFTSLLAYSMLMLAAIQAALFAILTAIEGKRPVVRVAGIRGVGGML